MPKFGLTMTEGIVSDWNVGVGSTVKEGDVIFSVETEKIVTEVEARASGEIISIDAEAGETVAVGAVVATWTGPTASIEFEEEVAEGPNGELAAPESSELLNQSTESDRRIKASPSAKRFATQHGISLKTVSGTGPGGRIKLSDLEQLVGNAVAGQDSGDSPNPTEPATRNATRFEKIVASRLSESKQTIPHFYVHGTADVTDLIERRAAHNEKSGPAERLSFNDFVILAVARGLAELPELNAIWDSNTIKTPATIDISMAVDTERGLLVPVLRDLSSCSIQEVSQRSRTQSERARSGQLAAEDMEGGIMTISNVGMYGNVSLVPIINPGQSAILGVGAPSAVFRPDERAQPELRQEMPLVLACDHRIYDGVRATKLLQLVCRNLANPSNLLGE